MNRAFALTILSTLSLFFTGCMSSADGQPLPGDPTKLACKVILRMPNRLLLLLHLLR
jgi:hypothetical protein